VELLEDSMQTLSRAWICHIDDLKECCWLDGWERNDLVRELGEFLEFANEVRKKSLQKNIIGWWKDQQTRWKSFAECCAALRYSLSQVLQSKDVLNAIWGFKKGDQHLEDYVETSVMLAFNCSR